MTLIFNSRCGKPSSLTSVLQWVFGCKCCFCSRVASTELFAPHSGFVRVIDGDSRVYSF